tara:strand:- start:265 stop:519 length:255 start_codon:yes stop_codon:yes gene_type:complete
VIIGTVIEDKEREMATVTELRQITQRKNEIRDDYDVQILELIDIITKAYMCGPEIGREVANNRRNSIAARLQKSVEDTSFDYRD